MEAMKSRRWKFEVSGLNDGKRQRLGETLGAAGELANVRVAAEAKDLTSVELSPAGAEPAAQQAVFLEVQRLGGRVRSVEAAGLIARAA